MRRRLVVTADAERQIRDAAAWWSENRQAAPGLLHEELSRSFELITGQPRIGSPALDAELSGVRRLHLFRTRYYLYYRERGPDTVEILALWHTSRGSGPALTMAGDRSEP